MALSPDLKPCPFCGGVAELIPVRKNDYYYQCSRCAAAAQPADTAEEAVIPWNRRPSSPPEDELSKLSGGWEKARAALERVSIPLTLARAFIEGAQERATYTMSASYEQGIEMLLKSMHEAEADVAEALSALTQDHAPVRGRGDSEFGQTSSSTDCADAQERRSGGDS